MSDTTDEIYAQRCTGGNLDRYDAHDGTTAAHERRITRCRTCQARIVWLKTAAGKNMPVDADSVEPGDETFEYGRHVSHFSTCKQADQHRRRK